MLCCLGDNAGASPAALNPAQKVSVLRNQARFALLDQNYPLALSALDQALALEPKNHDLLLFKVKALRESAGGDKAVEFMRRLWERDEAAFAFLRFEAGYIRVQEKAYDKALVHFRHAEKADRQRAIGEQGLTYLRMGQPGQALEAFKRLEQRSAQNLYLMGQAQVGLKQYQPAREVLQQALAAQPTARQEQDISSLLKSLAAAERAERPWRAFSTVMVQYQDNVFRDPLQSYPGQQPSRGKGDFSFLFKQDLQYRLGRWDKLSYGLSGQAQYLGYAQLHQGNYLSWSLGAYLDYQGGNWGFALPYSYSYYWAESSLKRKVQMNSVMPVLWLQHSPNWRSEVLGLLQHRGYIQPGEPDVWRWRLGLTHFLSKDPRLLPHLRLGYALNQDIASDEVSGYLNWEVSLGGAVPLTKELSLDASLTYYRYLFDHRVDPYLLGKAGGEMDRKDDQLQAMVQLLYRPSADWLVNLGYIYNINDSNLRDNGGFEPYDFRSNSVWLMLTWSF